MRTSILITVMFLCFSSLAFSQGDTTKIRMKNKRIIIIDEKNKSDNAANEFKKNIKQLEDSISKLRVEADTIHLKNKPDADLEKKIADLEKQLEAYEKGLEDLTGENDDEHGGADIRIETDNDNGQEGDSHKHKHGHSSRSDKFRGHWGGLGLGFNTLATKNGSFSLPDGTNGGIDGRFLDNNMAKSINFSLDLIPFSIPVIGKRFGFVTGLGFQMSYFSLKGNYTVNVNKTSGQTEGGLDAINYTSNSLATYYLNIPLLLEINSEKGYFLNCGVLCGVRTGSNQEQQFSDNGKNYDVIASADFNLNPIKYSALVNIGYKHIGLFAQYQLNSMFKTNKGPEVYPVAVGLKLVF